MQEMATIVKKLTYADYEKMPTDGFRHEIIEGEEYMTPAPNPDHQTIVGNAFRLVANHVVTRNLGRVFVAPTDVVLGKHDIVEPDIFFIARKHLSIIGPNNIQGAPDLVVEVLSPSTAGQDKGSKSALYERAGVREYWIVDGASQTFEIREFGSPRRTRVYKGGQSFQSDLLPGLTLSLEDLFSAE
jgi:Uma2 family endonuclease